MDGVLFQVERGNDAALGRGVVEMDGLVAHLAAHDVATPVGHVVIHRLNARVQRFEDLRPESPATNFDIPVIVQNSASWDEATLARLPFSGRVTKETNGTPDPVLAARAAADTTLAPILAVLVAPGKRYLRPRTCFHLVFWHFERDFRGRDAPLIG